MRRSLIAVLTLGLLLSGCCARTNQTTGVVTKSFANCFLAAQDLMCNPPADVMSNLEAWAPIVQAVIETAVPQSAPFLSAINAKQAIVDLQTGACTLTTNINALIQTLQSAPAAQANAKAAKALPASLNVQSLLAWKSSQGK